DRGLDLGDLEWLAGDLVEALRVDEVLRAQQRNELAVVHLRNDDLVEPFQEFAQVSRQRPDVAQVNVRDVEPVGAAAVDSAANRAVGRAPADHGEPALAIAGLDTL